MVESGAKYLIFPLLLVACYGTSCTVSQPVTERDQNVREEQDAIPDAQNEQDEQEKIPDREKRAILEALIAEVSSIGTVNSFLVRKENQLITEQYFDRMSPGQAANIKSASKSILSLLIGIAIDKGYLESVEQTLETFFPDYFNTHPDRGKASITIQDLLTMRSGLQTTSFIYYGEWISSDDWVRFVLDRPLIQERGGRMVYSTGSSHLLSVILTKASGKNTFEFANEYLLGPMGIEMDPWERDPQGYFLGGNDMALTPRDMLKIGQLVMAAGSYNGEQLVSEKWIRDSFETYSRSPFSHYDYGYSWWAHTVADYQVTFAWGYAGQYILMFPELDAIVAITSDIADNNGSRAYQPRIFSFIETSLIPYLEM
ncbi:MAG: serine hydrolase [Balneolaceae bacterium]